MSMWSLAPKRLVCRTSSGNRTSIRFLAIGDWGGLPYPPYVTAVQKTTAREMSKVAEQMGADFILALGDNFYFRGVESVDSQRFQVSWVSGVRWWLLKKLSHSSECPPSGNLWVRVHGQVPSSSLVRSRWQPWPRRKRESSDRLHSEIGTMVSSSWRWTAVFFLRSTFSNFNGSLLGDSPRTTTS